MPDPTLSDAIREAYASAPVDEVILHTLELWHPAFSVPIRVVRDRVALEARIEAGAARDAGAIVTFVAYAFDVIPPEVTSEGAPELTIEIDNVDRAILAQLDLAVVSDDPVSVIYRAYLDHGALDGPETDPPLEMVLTAVSATPFRLRATASFATLHDRAFPGLFYDLETFPGLAP
jgi:hypothetical protein